MKRTYNFENQENLSELSDIQSKKKSEKKQIRVFNDQLVSANTYNDLDNIKKVLDAWYTGGTTTGGECNNVNCNFTALATKLTNYSTSIANTPYCNDRSIGFGSGYLISQNTTYGAYERLYSNSLPSLKCIQDTDKFSTTNENANKLGPTNDQ